MSFSRLIKRLAAGASALVIAVGLTACGASGDEDAVEPGTSGTAPATSAPGAGEPTAEQASSLPVSAFEYGYDLQPPTTPGTYTFELTNDGSMPHDLVIEGEGVTGGTAVIGGGETDSFTVDLAPGTYTLFCSVGSHRAQGMEVTFSVG